MWWIQSSHVTVVTKKPPRGRERHHEKWLCDEERHKTQRNMEKIQEKMEAAKNFKRKGATTRSRLYRVQVTLIPHSSVVEEPSSFITFSSKVVWWLSSSASFSDM